MTDNEYRRGDIIHRHKASGTILIKGYTDRFAVIPRIGETKWFDTLDQALKWFHRLNRFALPPAVELSLNDKIVLAATVGLKSFARFDEANQVTGITREQWEATKASLIERKLLNKAGAATDAGRNAISGIRLGSKYGNEPLVKGWLLTSTEQN